MNRRSILGGGLAIIFSAFGTSAFAVEQPSLKPKRIGQVIVWRNKKYTAIKSGKKIVWDKGIPIVSSPSASATPTASPSASAQEKPISGPPKISEIRVAASSSLADGETKIFMNNDANGRGKPYILTRSPKGVVAFDNVCTHAGCGVELEAHKLICKCHSSYFDSDTGKVISGPANSPLKSYEVKEINGEIFVLDFPW
jgi:nitrite reductase/ring-hydroxylating ferredoxin subunit